MEKKYKAMIAAAVCLVFACCIVWAMRPEPVTWKRDIFAMNTYISLAVYDQNGGAVLDEAERQIHEWEEHVSVTNKDSDVYRINHSGGKRVQVHADTAEVLRLALAAAGQTDGALEPTLYPVLKAWGFTTDSKQVPGEAEIQRLLKQADYRQVVLDKDTVQLPEGMEIDLGAVGKGYASQKTAELMKKRHITAALLNFGGNIQVIGRRPDGNPWRIGIRHPEAEEDFAVLELEDEAAVTSGGYQNFFLGEDGTVYHHILDPKTGYPARNGILSATIIGKDGGRCDSLSTAVYVMGADKAAAFWREHRDFEMVLFTADHTVYWTEGLEGRFQLRGAYKTEVIR